MKNSRNQDRSKISESTVCSISTTVDRHQRQLIGICANQKMLIYRLCYNFNYLTDPPFITTLQTFPHAIAHDHKALLGSNITLYCTAHGNPKPVWKWTICSKDVSLYCRLFSF